MSLCQNALASLFCSMVCLTAVADPPAPPGDLTTAEQTARDGATDQFDLSLVENYGAQYWLDQCQYENDSLMQLVAAAETAGYPGPFPLGYDYAIASLWSDLYDAAPHFVSGDISVGEGDDVGTGTLERMNYYGDAEDFYLTAGSKSAVVKGDAEALCGTIQDIREQFELDYCTWLSQQ